MMTVDRSDSTRNHFVYRYFDSQGRLLYVGYAVNLDRRWQEHRLTRPGMASQVSAARIAGPFCFQVARSVERKALESEGPLYGWTPLKQSIKQRWDARGGDQPINPYWDAFDPTRGIGLSWRERADLRAMGVRLPPIVAAFADTDGVPPLSLTDHSRADCCNHFRR